MAARWRARDSNSFERGGGRREEGGGRREAVGRNGHQGQVGGAEPFLNPCLTGRLANLSPSMEDALRDALQGCSPGMLSRDAPEYPRSSQEGNKGIRMDLGYTCIENTGAHSNRLMNQIA